MKPTDLRIGNLIKLASFGPNDLAEEDRLIALDFGYRIFTITGKILMEYEKKGDDFAIKPVLLTKKIMEDLGFKNSNPQNPNYWGNKYLDGNLMEDGFMIAHYPSAPCKYAHQLQNIAYVLTGQELPINLKIRENASN